MKFDFKIVLTTYAIFIAAIYVMFMMPKCISIAMAPWAQPTVTGQALHKGASLAAASHGTLGVLGTASASQGQHSAPGAVAGTNTAPSHCCRSSR